MLRSISSAAVACTRGLISQARWQTNAALAREQERLEKLKQLGDFGQPTAATHPGRLADDEITPQISASEYAARRAGVSALARLPPVFRCSLLPTSAGTVRRISFACARADPAPPPPENARRRAAFAARMPPDSVAVLCAAPTLYNTGTAVPVPTAYRQRGNFLYLTGVTQPGCVAILEKPGGAPAPRFTLLVPPADAWHTLWNGPRLTVDAAVDFAGADAAEDSGRMAAVVEEALSRAAKGFILWDGPHDACALSAGVDKIIARHCSNTGRTVAAAVGGIASVLRWVKSPAEIALMRSAAAASAAGIAAAAAVGQPGVLEDAAAAAHQWQTRIRGAQRLSFPTVAGSGPNATFIHYSRSDRRVQAGDLFLMDAGCELHGYVSDVTRTWPVSGKFTGAQRDLYGSVLEAHAECLRGVREGATLRDIHELSVALLSKAIASLGLVRGASADAVAKGPYRRFYPHSVGHWLGLDVHDTPGVPLSQPLRPGVVLTIEPGLYVPMDAEGVPDDFRGLGVRIEDDVLVTKGKPEVLSGAAPVGAAAMEAFAEEGRRRFPWLAAQAREALGAAPQDR